ncbi:MAG: hypothetical protein D3907_15810, partial [Candidatus Electrothrix sp. AUS3]|nr:hypothetical protein [Candidatus Electrothrix gigas]
GPTGISSNQVTYTIEEPPVNPAVAQSPMSGPPGTTFTQWGDGFTPNSTTTLHFKKPDGSEYPTQQQAIDSSGHFEIPYTAPTDKAPGQYTWWAVDGPTGISSNQVTYTIEEPPVNPVIAQGPMSGPPGTTFTQWGTGFTPNSTATLHFKKPDGSEYPTQPQVMDSTGHFDIPYPSPTDKEPGQYTWWAVDGPTGISSNQVTYTIDAPTYKLKIGIQSSPKQIIQSGEGLVFYIDIVNEGIADAVDIPVTITHADNFGINGISVWGCDPKESENPACKRTDISSTGANFLVSIPAGSSAKLIGTGIVEAAPVAVVVTASEVTETVIRGPKPPADLPGIQKVELCS